MMISKEVLGDIAGDLIKDIKSIEYVTSSEVTEVQIPETECVYESKLFDSALKSDFNSNEELSAKKVMAAAMIIAKRKGLLPAGMPEIIDRFSAASLADEAVARMKTGFMTAIGKIDPSDAADKLIDQATARLIAVSDTVVKHVLDVAVNKLGTVVATAFPPAIPVVLVVKSYLPAVTKVAQKTVRTGIKLLGNVAKRVVKNTIETVKAVAKSKFKKLLSIQ